MWGQKLGHWDKGANFINTLEVPVGAKSYEIFIAYLLLENLGKFNLFITSQVDH